MSATRPCPFHLRALADNGVTIRQSTEAFPTSKDAEKAAKRAERITGEDHVVCISLAPKDPRNQNDAGWKVYDPKTDTEEKALDAKK